MMKNGIEVTAEEIMEAIRLLLVLKSVSSKDDAEVIQAAINQLNFHLKSEAKP